MSENAGTLTEAIETSPDAGKPVIRVSDVSKVYRIWKRPASRLRTMALECAAGVVGAHAGIAQRLRLRARAEYRDFLALSGVEFEVGEGESIAIIGRNGSGKSTLLQIIAGTLKPSTGDAAVHGRVAALLELGSAFHPQFTGRENVYLYCAILGIARNDVDELFDEIVSFADIGEFMDQPVKTYSSGMVLRLAFSVQTAIAPEILIVDEALAVGDMFFQAKCMRRIRDLMDKGTTLLFVSHSMSVVRELCDRAILLNEGRMVLDDEVGRVTQRYLAIQIGAQAETAKKALNNEVNRAAREVQQGSEGSAATPNNTVSPFFASDMFENKAAPERIQDGRARFRNVQTLNASGSLVDVYEFDELATFRMLVEVQDPVDNLWVGYHIRTKTGVDAIHVDTSLCGEIGRKFHAGETYILDWRFPVRLQHGNYYIMCVMGIPDPPDASQPQWDYIDVVNHACDFSVTPRGQGMIGGIVAPPNELTIRTLSETEFSNI